MQQAVHVAVLRGSGREVQTIVGGLGHNQLMYTTTPMLMTWARIVAIPLLVGIFFVTELTLEWQNIVATIMNLVVTFMIIMATIITLLVNIMIKWQPS